MGKNWQEMKVLVMTVHSVQIRSQDGRPTAVFSTISGNLGVSNNVRKFYGQYNNIRTVLGYGTCEIRVVHLCKVYCLSALMYGCESWHLQNKEQSRISVAWNNCFRSIFNCCWRESVNTLPINYLIHQRKLLYWNKLFTSDNVLFS